MASTDDSDWGEFLQWDDPDALQDPPLHLPASLPANNYEEEAQKGNANESKASNGELQLPTPCSDPIDFDISDWPQNISAIDAFDTILKGVGTEETQQFIAAPTSEPPNSSPQAFNHADFTVQPVISPLHDSIAHVSTGLLPSSSFQNLGSADFSLGPVISTQNNSFANTGIGDVYLAEDSYPLIDPAFPQIANPYTIQHYPYPYLFQSQYDSSPANMMVFNNPPYISHQSWNDLDFMAQLPSPLMDAYMGVNHSPASFIHTGNDSIQLEWHPSRLEKDAPPLDSLGHSSNERDEISQDGTPKTQLPPARDITSSVLSTTPPCVKASVHGCKQIHTSGRVSKPKKPKGARDSTITRALRVQGVCVACFYQKDRVSFFLISF
jgi:hypothetical protein